MTVNSIKIAALLYCYNVTSRYLFWVFILF